MLVTSQLLRTKWNTSRTKRFCPTVFFPQSRIDPVPSPSSGHPGSSRWKIGPWPGVYAEESSAVFSTNYFLVRGKHGGVSYNNSVIYGPRRRRGMHVGSVANHMIGQWSTVSGGRPVVGFVNCWCPNFSIKFEVAPHVIHHQELQWGHGNVCNHCYVYLIIQLSLF